MLPLVSRAGDWFLRSGIQEPSGGVARYYRADLERSHRVSTEITGYAASTLVYLHSLTGDQRYLDRALAAGRFLAGATWDPASCVLPFEPDAPAFTYFFDCGIAVRGLLSVWRATGAAEFLAVAAMVGDAMSRDFAAGAAEFHPILSLPEKRPLPRDPARWSQSPGCYQLKSAMAWWDLSEATGDLAFRQPYETLLPAAMLDARGFLPGHPVRAKVMDRLHAYLYFLEGLLPCAGEPPCATSIREGIGRVAERLRGIAPEFERSDVYAQLLRLRLYAAAIAPLDRAAAHEEAALALWDGADAYRHLLI
ncbi:MAG: hypothetical protein ABSF62_04775 [Bryobacteraceae bacterium]